MSGKILLQMPVRQETRPTKGSAPRNFRAGIFCMLAAYAVGLKGSRCVRSAVLPCSLQAADRTAVRTRTAELMQQINKALGLPAMPSLGNNQASRHSRRRTITVNEMARPQHQGRVTFEPGHLDSAIFA